MHAFMGADGVATLRQDAIGNRLSLSWAAAPPRGGYVV